MDGELVSRDARDVEARLDQDPAAKQKLAAMAEVGAVVREHYQAETADIEAKLAGMWGRIEAQLDGAGAREPARAAREADGGGGLWAWIVETFTPRTVAVGLVGVAAGVAIAFGVLGHRRPLEVNAVINVPVESVETAPPVVTAEATQIEELDVASGSAMVFQVPSDNAAVPATTVIWVTSDSSAEEPI